MMPNAYSELSAVVASRRSYERLIADRNVDALFNKMRLEMSAASWNTSVESERMRTVGRILRHPNSLSDAQFGGVHINKIDETNEPELRIRYKTDPKDPKSPIDIVSSHYLQLHFHPKNLSSIRKDLSEAGQWMQEQNLAEEFPVVVGCTYRELARVAFLHGMQPVLGLSADYNYRENTRICHQIFLMLNNKPPETEFTLAAAYAPTAQLAEHWANK